MSLMGGGPLVLRGSLTDWEHEFRARLAVSEEEGELGRALDAAHSVVDQIRAETDAELARMKREVSRVRAETDAELARMGREGEQIRAELGREIAQLQAETGQEVAWLQAENHSLTASLERTRKVLNDLRGSRGYRLIRRLGRWESLDRDIRRALK